MEGVGGILQAKIVANTSTKEEMAYMRDRGETA